MRSYWRVSIGHVGDPLQGWKQGTKDEGHWNPAIVDWGDSYVVSFHKNYIKFIKIPYFLFTCPSWPSFFYLVKTIFIQPTVELTCQIKHQDLQVMFVIDAMLGFKPPHVEKKLIS